ncbi:MAG: SRPBCC domain-containing protein [Pseudomonadota bacterium]
MKTWPLIVAFSTAVAGIARAEVLEVHETSFVVEAVVMAEAAPAAVYRSLVRVSQWWDPKHTWSGSAKNLKLEPKAGGCFCEALAGGGSVQHGRVVFAQPGRQLRIDGALGPLQEMAVTGVLTFKMAPDGPGTRVTLTYRVAGALTMDSAKLAAGVDQVLRGQLDRLRTFASGAPAGP